MVQVLRLKLPRKLLTLEGFVLFQDMFWRVVIPAVARDAFSYNREAECLVIIVKRVGHAWRVYLKSSVEGKMRKDKTAARREQQLTRELKRQDEIITNAKPEESILIDGMQDNNNDEVERRVELDAEYLQD